MRPFGRQRARDILASERATASLEAALLLPFIFLIIALLFNLGYGSFMRMRTAGATRFGATYYIYLRSTGAEPEPSRKESLKEVQDRYFPDSDPVQLKTASDSGENLKWKGGAPGGFAGTVAGLLGTVSSRDRVELTVPREVPTGTLLPDTPAQGMLILDGNTWTCREVSLTLQTLTSLPGELAGKTTGSGFVGKVATYLGGSLFWVLGMQAGFGDPCE